MKEDDNKWSDSGPSWFHGGPGNWPKILQAGRGNIKPIILQALNEKPMHGYEIISHFANRSHGHWRPSPGSVYPMLKKLEAEGLIQPENINDRIKYKITIKGKKLAKEQNNYDPWQGVKHPEVLAGIGPLMKEFMPLMHQIAVEGGDREAKDAEKIIKVATLKLKQLHKEFREKK